MNILLGVLFLLLPFITLFGIVCYIEGLKLAVEVYLSVFGILIFVGGCFLAAKYFLGNIL